MAFSLAVNTGKECSNDAGLDAYLNQLLGDIATDLSSVDYNSWGPWYIQCLVKQITKNVPGSSIHIIETSDTYVSFFQFIKKGEAYDLAIYRPEFEKLLFNPIQATVNEIMEYKTTIEIPRILEISSSKEIFEDMDFMSDPDLEDIVAMVLVVSNKISVQYAALLGVNCEFVLGHFISRTKNKNLDELLLPSKNQQNTFLIKNNSVRDTSRSKHNTNSCDESSQCDTE